MKKLLPLLLGAIAVFSGSALAQNATTTPVGAMTYTINANSSKAFSLPLHDAVPEGFVGAVSGRISSISAAAITVDGAGWVPGALSVKASPFFIKITSGAAEGRLLEVSTTVGGQNTSTTLSVSNQGTDLTTLGIAVGTDGDTFQIIPADTLKTLFGNTPRSGTTAKTADNIARWTGGSWQTFYFNSVNNRWQISTSSTSADDVILRPDVGYLYTRRDATSITFTFTGVVPTSDTQVSVKNAGTTFVGNGFPVDIPLSSFASLSGWTSTANYKTSDTISRWTGGSWQKFFFDSVDNRWELSTGANASTVKILAGTPVMIERVGNLLGSSFLAQALPYSP
jgi:uncharacterized protein (TIGR02597 family)